MGGKKIVFSSCRASVLIFLPGDKGEYYVQRAA